MSLRDLAAERRLKLALYVREMGPVTRWQIQQAVGGYEGGDAKPESVRRTFERDKAALAQAGVSIVAGPDGRHTLDRAASLGAPLQLSKDESALLRTICTALVCDPSYAFKDELRGVLAKLGEELEAPDALEVDLAAPQRAVGIPAQERRCPAGTMHKVRTALSEHRPLSFTYTSPDGAAERRCVEAVGVFTLEGHRYLAAIDLDTGLRRSFRLDRMGRVSAGADPLPGSAEPFRREQWLFHPFQLGSQAFEAQILFTADAVWQAPAATAGKGELAVQPDGSAIWRIDASDAEELARWCILRGAGVYPLSPSYAASAYRDGLLRAMEVYA